MALFGRSKSEDGLDVEVTNIIGKGTTISGNIHTVGNIRIDGEVKGNIETQAKLVLRPDAVIEGKITAFSAEVAGAVKGNLLIGELVTLKATARIQGDIHAQSSAVEPGAEIDGRFKVGEAPQLKLTTPQRPALVEGNANKKGVKLESATN